MQTCRRDIRSSTSQREPCASARCGEDVPSIAQAAIDSVMPQANVEASATYVDTRRKQRVALFHFSVPGAYHTLLWSHGNAMDIGEMCAAAPTPMTSSRSPFCAPATAPPSPAPAGTSSSCSSLSRRASMWSPTTIQATAPLPAAPPSPTFTPMCSPSMSASPAMRHAPACFCSLELPSLDCATATSSPPAWLRLAS